MSESSRFLNALWENSEPEQSRIGFDPEVYAPYRNDPVGFYRDVLGFTELTPEQVRIINDIRKRRRILIRSGNNTGKTYSISGYVVYFMCVSAAEPDEFGVPQGGLFVLTSSSSAHVENVVWGSVLEHIHRAEARGYPIPGTYSEASVTWRVHEQWRIEKISPPRRVNEEQQHSAAGRHHKNLIFWGDEAPGIESARYRTADGMASGTNNKIVWSGNPTEAVGPFKNRADDPTYTVIQVSSLNHPNVKQRYEVIGGAQSHVDMDGKVRTWCEEMGDYPEYQPDPAYHDFVYALHPDVGTEHQEDIPDPRPFDGSLPDGTPILGHADAKPKVYRPRTEFLTSVLGMFPVTEISGLFSTAAIDASMEQFYKRLKDYDLREGIGMKADYVGFDVAEAGGDRAYAVGRYDARTITGLPLKIIGKPVEIPSGLSESLARNAFAQFGDKPIYVVDALGVGSGTENNLDVYRQAKTFRFRGNAKASSEASEPLFMNLRAAAYWRFAQDVNRGRVILPPDDELKKELLATKYEYSAGKLKIIDKRIIKQQVGHSPDKADAVVMACFDAKMRTAVLGGFNRNEGVGSVKGEPPPDFYYGGTNGNL